MQFISGSLLPVDHDDMLFCVYSVPRAGQRLVAVRREAGGELPADLAYGAGMYNAMDWRATVLLNIAMHTRYELQLCAGKCGPPSASWLSCFFFPYIGILIPLLCIPCYFPLFVCRLFLHSALFEMLTPKLVLVWIIFSE